jgi:protein-tyrosine phosphatase
MLFFRKKENTSVDLGWLQTDMHSHLIPGIDDGSPDLKTSLELVKGFANLGYRKIITTPHILWDVYPNTRDIILDKYTGLKNAVIEAGIDIQIEVAAEYYIDEHFYGLLKNKTPLLTLGGNMVLVEFSMLSAPFDLQDMLFEMQLQNYQPVIAHPERYSYLNRKREVFDELRNSGCLFQLNLLSLQGYYGNAVKELAEYLLKKDYYDFAGSDLHHERHMAGLQKLKTANWMRNLMESSSIKNHLL